MKNMRMLGNMIQKLAQEQGKTTEDISKLLECRTEQIERVYKGFVLFPP